MNRMGKALAAMIDRLFEDTHQLTPHCRRPATSGVSAMLEGKGKAISMLLICGMKRRGIRWLMWFTLNC